MRKPNCDLGIFFYLLTNILCAVSCWHMADLIVLENPCR